MGWLTDYLDYTNHQESPEIFHFWVGMSVLASVLNRQVWIDRRDYGVTWYRVYPGQLMCTLVSPPGKCHKGTALRMGKRMMESAGVRIIKGKGSTERLINKLATPTVHINGTQITQTTDAIATLYIPELSVLISKQTYADSLVDFLTEIYDAEDPFDYMTQKGGDVRLHNPCLTVLAASNPVSIGESVSEKAHGTGYLSRVIHIYSDEERPSRSLTDLDDSDVTKEELDRIASLETKLVDGLNDIKNYRGPFSYSPEGKKWMDDWLRQWKSSPEGQGDGWPTRRQDHLLRSAQIIAIGEHRSKLLTDGILYFADVHLQKAESMFHMAFANIGQNPSARNQERILEAIRKAGGRMSSPVIYHRFHGYYKNITELINDMKTLTQAGKIKLSAVVNNIEWWELI